MTRQFDTEDEARSYTVKVSAGSVRFVSECRVCGTPCAVSQTARWSVSANLFGQWIVDRVEEERPSPDPCGHGQRVWTRVQSTPNPGRACGVGCRSASSAFCSCSCDGANHGMMHRIRTVS